MTRLLLKPLGLQHFRDRDHAVVMPERVAGYTTDRPAHQVRKAS
jgi:hypothetical protein